ncbi:MAG: serine/threonine protein kinase, partial [Deltaproteobacteria bacterium]|nr:serine/threonine protein kinase [Deltaproteobacteria bacterium]
MASLIEEVYDIRFERSLNPERGSPPRVRFADRFELEEPIGSGGMSVVFAAHDIKLGRAVALKLLDAVQADAEQCIEHEARCIARISHPNVVTVFDTGRCEHGVFLTMELVAGFSALRWLRHPTSWQMAVEIYVMAGQGLLAAHQAGIVHGDFKPANVLIEGQGRYAKVADFGIARLLEERARATEPTTEPVAGTLGYTAPERMRGGPPDPLADQFAFCVALWERLAGRRPFDGDTGEAVYAAMLTRDLRDRSLLPRGVPRRLHAILRKGLAFDPSERFASMQELLRELGELPEQLADRRRRLCGGVLGLGLLVAIPSVLAVGVAIGEERRGLADLQLASPAARRSSAS